MRKHVFTLLLGAAMVATALEEQPLPADFPAEEIRNYENLHTGFHFAPHTKARFTQQRTMPSGKVLQSRGSFEFRRGVGMMWRTESPILTAMVISKSSLVVYGSRGQELRRTRLDGSPFSRYTTVFLDGAKPDHLKDLTRAFRVTGRETAQGLTLGLQALREEMDLRWLMVEVVGGDVSRVEYSSLRQGHTAIQFTEVQNADAVPDKPFYIKER